MNVARSLAHLCGSAAWLILGGTLFARTEQSDSSQKERLTSQWGSAQTQVAPQVTARVAVDTYNKDKQRVERGYEEVGVPLKSSRIAVGLNLEQRRKGLLWYNLYDVRFVSHYRVRNDTNSSDPASALSVSNRRTEVTCRFRLLHRWAKGDRCHRLARQVTLSSRSGARSRDRRQAISRGMES